MVLITSILLENELIIVNKRNIKKEDSLLINLTSLKGNNEHHHLCNTNNMKDFVCYSETGRFLGEINKISLISLTYKPLHLTCYTLRVSTSNNIQRCNIQTRKNNSNVIMITIIVIGKGKGETILLDEVIYYE